MRDGISYDDRVRERVRAVQQELGPLRDEIIVHTQFRRNVAVSPLNPNWGRPNPIDINGLIERIFGDAMQLYNAIQQEMRQAQQSAGSS